MNEALSCSDLLKPGQRYLVQKISALNPDQILEIICLEVSEKAYKISFDVEKYPCWCSKEEFLVDFKIFEILK